MSINWVMTAPSTSLPYVPLPGEKTLFTSSPRVALSISNPPTTSKQQPPLSINASSGVIYLSNRRIIFLPDKGTPALQSFAAPLLNLHDSHVTAPWFGPNAWLALLIPTSGGGITAPAGGGVELKLTFKEGGAYDFHTAYERVRERLQQAADVARLDQTGDARPRTNISGVDVGNVHLDQLPAYAEASDGALLPPIPRNAPSVQPAPMSLDPQTTLSQDGELGSTLPSHRSTRPSHPVEPPPGYEEAQLAGLHDEVERRRHEMNNDF